MAALAPEIVEKPTPVVTSTPASKDQTGTSDEYNLRLAAGKGKLQEVELDSNRAIQDKQVETQPTSKVRLGRDGKPRRHPKRRNSEDLRRDQMVEAVLREAKCTSAQMPITHLFIPFLR